MAFVHSLVKSKTNGKTGWCAPVEFGEAAPHYISFVIPVDENRDFFEEYTCETITVEGDRKRAHPHALVKQGEDSFVLRYGESEFWFTVRPTTKHDRFLPYVGKLQHDDFRCVFVEIEPDDPATLDKLYNDDNTFIIGCEPSAHYNVHNEVLNTR